MRLNLYLRVPGEALSVLVRVQVELYLLDHVLGRPGDARVRQEDIYSQLLSDGLRVLDHAEIYSIGFQERFWLVNGFLLIFLV